VAIKQVTWACTATEAKRSFLSEHTRFNGFWAQSMLQGVPPRTSLQGGQAQ